MKKCVPEWYVIPADVSEYITSERKLVIDFPSAEVQQEVFVYLLKKQYEELLWSMKHHSELKKELKAAKTLLKFNMLSDEYVKYIDSFKEVEPICYKPVKD